MNMTISAIAIVTLIMKEPAQFITITVATTTFCLAAATKQLMEAATTENVLDCSCKIF